MTDQRDDDGRLSRPLPSDPAELGDRAAAGGLALGGGSSGASSGAFDTVGGGDIGGPGSRDPGDSAGDLRPATALAGGDLTGDLADAARRAETREDAERLAAEVFRDPGGDAASGALKAQARAQGRDDAQPDSDTSRAQSGGINNDSL